MIEPKYKRENRFNGWAGYDGHGGYHGMGGHGGDQIDLMMKRPNTQMVPMPRARSSSYNYILKKVNGKKTRNDSQTQSMDNSDAIRDLKETR